VQKIILGRTLSLMGHGLRMPVTIHLALPGPKDVQDFFEECLN